MYDWRPNVQKIATWSTAVSKPEYYITNDLKSELEDKSDNVRTTVEHLTNGKEV